VKPYGRKLREPARELRVQMTASELVLWEHIRRKQLHGLQFYRQKPLLGFIVDFYCPAAKLVVEIDGIHHGDPEFRVKDEIRDRELLAIGVHVLRFGNQEVLERLPTVLADIERVLRKNPHPTSPFFKGEEQDGRKT